MASDPTQSKGPMPSNLQSIVARLKGMVDHLSADSQSPPVEAPPTSELPVLPDSPSPSDTVTFASPTSIMPVIKAMPTLEYVPEREQSVVPPPLPPAPSLPTASSTAATCPACGACFENGSEYCPDCGLVLGKAKTEQSEVVGMLQGRYQQGALCDKRGELERFYGMDFGAGIVSGVPVMLVRSPLAPAAGTAKSYETPPGEDPQPATEPDLHISAPGENAWLTAAWEMQLLEKLQNPSVPGFRDYFEASGYAYLVEELPSGTPLWDAWDDPDQTAYVRYSWLKQIVEALFALHQSGAIVEGLHPDRIVIDLEGRARMKHLGDVLPLPLPVDAPLKGALYSAPELVLKPAEVDARADLYAFGALLYMLDIGRELAESDFELTGMPKSYFAHFPDAHPLLARVIAKTFCRDARKRFPTDEASQLDSTGFVELARVLDECRRVLDQPRMEIAAWTTTGMLRSGNEDSFAVLHMSRMGDQDVQEAALLLLADGMGGYEAGEVAASMAIRAMKAYLLEQPPFRIFKEEPRHEPEKEELEDTAIRAPLHERLRGYLEEALQQANSQVFDLAIQTQRTMGCTGEVVYLQGNELLIAHVGDSRVYQLRRGRLEQITVDQTWVRHMCQRGLMSEDDAAKHPRRNELQQAIGGQDEVSIEYFHTRARAGEWVLVCSDGLNAHLDDTDIQELLLSAPSAEWAARRLVHLANAKGGSDNTTVLVVRLA